MVFIDFYLQYVNMRFSVKISFYVILKNFTESITFKVWYKLKLRISALLLLTQSKLAKPQYRVLCVIFSSFMFKSYMRTWG